MACSGVHRKSFVLRLSHLDSVKIGGGKVAVRTGEY